MDLMEIPQLRRPCPRHLCGLTNHDPVGAAGPVGSDPRRPITMIWVTWGDPGVAEGGAGAGGVGIDDSHGFGTVDGWYSSFTARVTPERVYNQTCVFETVPA